MLAAPARCQGSAAHLQPRLCPTNVLHRQPFVGTAVAHPPSQPRRRRRAAAAGPRAQQVAARPAGGGARFQQPEAQAEGEQFQWTDTWWPIAFTKDIPEGQPYGFMLLEQPIVIWEDGEGRYRCFRDACPHRLVPLSDGRITPDGRLECPYHGWQFKGCGSCMSMPQGGDPSAARAAATAYQCAERQGLVWVKLQPAPADGSEPDTSGIRTIPELDDPDWFAFGDMWRDIPYDWATLIENVIDAGHVPFTHHGSVSKRQSSGSYADMRVTERRTTGFEGVWETGPRKGSLGAQLTLFEAPLMRHTIDAYDTRGFGNITAVYGVPVAPGRCRAIVRQPFRFKNKLIPKLFGLSPRFMGHLGNNSVLDEDVIFLHMQERESALRGMGDKPAGQVYFMPAASDAYVAGFRNWLGSTAGGGPWGPMNLANYLQRAGPRLPESQLLDHYHSHTERCHICQPALRNVRAARGVAAAVGAVAAAVAVAALVLQFAVQSSALSPAVAQAAGVPGVPALAAVPRLVGLAGVCGAVALLCFLAWRWCQNTIPRFFSGERPFARNRVAGEYAP